MEELIESINKPYTDYAIMLNGEWGSGKTYFWNNKLRSRLEAIPTKEGKRYKTIYMSLYGINSLEEISKKIFIETNPMISKTLKKFVDTREGNLIPEYVKTGLDMANLFGSMQFSSDKVDFSKLFAIDDKILCFDDLERANVDVIDILGYINNFVEHDGIKTIVICNESELATKFKNNNMELKTLIATIMLDREGKLAKQNSPVIKDEETDMPIVNLLEDKISDVFDKANAYERIKEKLIGETFEYIPEYSYILSGMIMKYSYNEPLHEFYKRNTSTIIAAFNKSNTRNLRILKHSLNDFEKIYNNVIKDYPNIDYQILKNILTFTIAVSFEIKAGNISKERLKSVKDNDDYISIIYTSKILNDNNKFYLREFDNKYFINNNSNYRFFKFVEVYIRTRYFDEKIYKDNMKDIMEVSDNKKTIKDNLKYTQILNGEYWKLSDTDFQILVGEVLEEVKVGKVKFDEYIKLFFSYKYLIDSGLLDMTLPELKQIFKLGMHLSASKFSNLSALTDEINDEYTASSDASVKWIIKEYTKIKEKVLQEKTIEKAGQLFKNIPNNISEFYKNIMTEYQNIPVFAKYDMEELIDRLEMTQNYDLYNIVTILQDRYIDKEDLYRQEEKNLKKLAFAIKQKTNTKEKTIKQVLLQNIAKSIETTTARYDIKE